MTKECRTCRKNVSVDSGKFKKFFIILHALRKNFYIRKFSNTELEELWFVCYPCHMMITDSLLRVY
jgi:hypothetical protein